MLKSAYVQLFVGGFLAVNPSCKKSHEDPNAIHGMVKKNGTFTQDFGLIGTEDGMTVSLAPRHALVSTLKRDINSGGHVIYTYKPAWNFTGTDVIEFTTSISTGGPPVATNKSTIQLTVTD